MTSQRLRQPCWQHAAHTDTSPAGRDVTEWPLLMLRMGIEPAAPVQAAHRTLLTFRSITPRETLFIFAAPNCLCAPKVTGVYVVLIQGWPWLSSADTLVTCCSVRVMLERVPVTIVPVRKLKVSHILCVCL